MHKRPNQVTWRAWLPVLCLIVHGCGQKPERTEFPVSGLVTFEGEPVKAGTVTFYNRQRNGGGQIKPDGTFAVNGDGLVPDQYYVAITPPDPEFGPVPGGPTPPRPEHPEIPQKYRTPVQSGFEVEVARQDNYFEFAMIREDEITAASEMRDDTADTPPAPPHSRRNQDDAASQIP